MNWDGPVDEQIADCDAREADLLRDMEANRQEAILIRAKLSRVRARRLRLSQPGLSFASELLPEIGPEGRLR